MTERLLFVRNSQSPIDFSIKVENKCYDSIGTGLGVTVKTSALNISYGEVTEGGTEAGDTL